MATDLVKQTTDIVVAYVANNDLPAEAVPLLLQEVFGALSRLPEPVPHPPDNAQESLLPEA